MNTVLASAEDEGASNSFSDSYLTGSTPLLSSLLLYLLVCINCTQGFHCDISIHAYNVL
jgi:hypothetical protein